MLPSFYRDFDREALPRIQKTVSGEDASYEGAFSFGTVITFTLHVPRRLGAAAVVLRLGRDGGAFYDTPLSFVSTERGVDVYRTVLDTAALCKGTDCGLFYYHFLFVRGMDTLFTDTHNNIDFTLSPHEARSYRLLVHTADFQTPAWFAGATMYHIFVDRFCRGEGYAPLRAGATLDPDWENGIPQFAPYPGAPLANDRFFGGNLWGIIEKLDYLKSLGVTVLYLSPIFEAASNHKYDTGDYETVDAAFGGETALAALIAKAKDYGMRIILDGVFNHTGADSRYFNRYGRYDTLGAYQSPDSPYAAWYSFKKFPDKYECWWDIAILPRLNSHLPEIREYLAGQNGIAASRVREGIAGWRLDVADELPNEFLDELRESLHAASSEQPLIIGEVWENAADKIAYGHRRRYFSGRQLDSVMNYPLRDGILAFVRDGDATALYDVLTELYSSYPRPVHHTLMNFLGTHDTERILTVLGDATLGEGHTNAELSIAKLSPTARSQAIEKLKIAFTLLFTVFGVPSVFYGDEAGLEGYRDPFCRRPFPWGREERVLVDTVRQLGQLRIKHPALATGDFTIVHHGAHSIAYERRCENDRLLVAANMSDEPLPLTIPGRWLPIDADTSAKSSRSLTILPHQACIYKEVRA
jgi:glycosidase